MAIIENKAAEIPLLCFTTFFVVSSPTALSIHFKDPWKAVFVLHPSFGLSSGIQQTNELVCNSFWWPNLINYVSMYVKSCRVCAQSKTPRELPAFLLEPLPIHQCPWSHLAVDFVTDLLSSNGYTTILVIIDSFSKVLSH